MKGRQTERFTSRNAPIMITTLGLLVFSTSVQGADALRLRSIQAGMAHVWVAGKTVLSPCYTRAISERFRDKELINKALYKFSCLLLLTLHTRTCSRYQYL